MDVARSLWIRVGSKLYPASNTAYSPLTGTSSPYSSSPYASGPDHDFTSDGLNGLDRRPVISWRTEPKFEVSFSLGALRRHLIPMLIALLPSFILPSRSRKARKLFPTSYLDGLRGVAAFFVVVHHYTTAYTTASPTGWGLKERKGEEPGAHKWFWLLPLVRVVHSGRFMVVIFFVISGYVLSHRSLKLARQGKHLELLDSLASSVFRRWLRLHLPVAASCFMAFMLGRWDLWHHMPKGWEHDPSGKTHLAGQPIPFPSPKGSFFHQLWDWYADTRQLSDPFLYGNISISRYNIGVLWTIPLEWMGSMLVFMTVLGLSRTKTWVKISVLCLLIYRAHATTRWVPATFLSGVLLAEVSFIYARPIEPSTAAIDSSIELEKPLPPSANKRSKSMAYKIFFTSLFLLGLYLGAQPKDGWHETPGYIWLYRHLPESYAHSPANRATFWPSIGGVLVVFALDMAPFLQSMFTTPLAQYLGEISFSLYMVHCQVQFTLGEWLVPRCMDITGGWENGQTGFLAGIALSLVVLGPLTFWVADVFSRLVDERCVKFARWVSVMATVKI